MNRIIVAIFLPEIADPAGTNLFRKFLQAANWFDADLHLLLPQRLRRELECHLRRHEMFGAGPASKTRKAVIEHIFSDDYLHEAVQAVQRLSADFLCIEAGEFGKSSSLDELKQSLLIETPIPAIVLPKHLNESFNRFRLIIVPISGEQRKSEAVREGLSIAHSTDTPVTLLHVSQAGETCCEVSGLESVGDEFHHEYAQQLDKIVSEASPSSSLSERKRVTRFVHLSGITREAITDFVRNEPNSLLIVEWKAILARGRAKTIKALLKSAFTPVLIVKTAAEAPSQLKVNGEFKAA